MSPKGRDAIVWRFEPFDALTGPALYALLQLRSQVFVVEQNCVFQDMDGVDDHAMHLLGTLDGQLVAYARCFEAGRKYAEASIGRVVTRDTLRGSGLGHALVQESIASLIACWGVQAIRIGAQQQLGKFYGLHGFKASGEPYSEDGIPHVEMVRSADASCDASRFAKLAKARG